MLKAIVEQSKKRQEKLDSLMIVGRSVEAAEIMQNYIDKTGDIQTVALLSVYFYIWNFP